MGTLVAVGHVSFFRRCGPCAFVVVPRPLRSNLGIVEFCSGFGDPLRMKRRRFFFFGELLAIWPFLCTGLRSPLDGLGHSSGQIVSSCVVCWTCVGRPITHLYPSGSFILRLWKRLVPIHSPHSNNRAACAQKRCQCLFASCSRSRRGFMGQFIISKGKVGEHVVLARRCTDVRTSLLHWNSCTRNLCHNCLWRISKSFGERL